MTEDRLNWIRRLINSWDKDLNDQQRVENIRNAFMEAKTTHEVTEILTSNISFIDRMGLWKLANLAKRRINNLNKVKRELTAIIYLN